MQRHGDKGSNATGSLEQLVFGVWRRYEEVKGNAGKEGEESTSLKFPTLGFWYIHTVNPQGLLTITVIVLSVMKGPEDTCRPRGNKLSPELLSPSSPPAVPVTLFSTG